MELGTSLQLNRCAASPVIATVLMVAITIVLAAVLYAIVVGMASGPGAVPQIIGLSVDHTPETWTVTVVSVPAAKLPNATFVLIRDANSNFLLARTPFSALTQANWSAYGVLYMDSSPNVDEVAAGDRLYIDRVRYPDTSVLEIEDTMRILAIQALQA